MARKQGIAAERLRELVAARGLRIIPQAAFDRVGTGRCVAHIHKKDPVTMVHLKGMDDLARRFRAVRPITEEAARRGHLGAVRGQLDFTRTQEEVLQAFDAALERIQHEERAIGRRVPSPAEPREHHYELTLSDDLARAIESIRLELSAKVPRGLDAAVTHSTTIRVLLHEAIQARSLPAPQLTNEEDAGLRVALDQVRERSIHGPDDVKRVIDSIIGQ